MANDLLKSLMESLDDENVGESVEDALMGALGNKVQNKLNSAGNKVKTDLGSSSGRVKTDLNSSSSRVKTGSIGSKLSGKTASFMNGAKKTMNTVMDGVGDSSNVGETIEDNIMGALGKKASDSKLGKKFDLSSALGGIGAAAGTAAGVATGTGEETAAPQVEQPRAEAEKKPEGYCEYCGGQNKPGSRFCTFCGAAL